MESSCSSGPAPEDPLQTYLCSLADTGRDPAIVSSASSMMQANQCHQPPFWCWPSRAATNARPFFNLTPLSSADIEREVAKLNTQETRLLAEIKREAKKSPQNAKIIAKQLVQLRAQRTNLQKSVATIKGQNTMLVVRTYSSCSPAPTYVSHWDNVQH